MNIQMNEIHGLAYVTSFPCRQIPWMDLGLFRYHWRNSCTCVLVFESHNFVLFLIWRLDLDLYFSFRFYNSLCLWHYFILNSALNVLGSFHLGFHCPWLYNHILITLQCDVQVAFCFPFDKLAHDLYDVVTWHSLLLLPECCLVLSLCRVCRGATRHREMRIQHKCILLSNWENLKEEFFYRSKL
jgi:hypothetical protein